MTEVTNWQKVKDRISRDREPILREFRLKLGKGKEDGEWCPVHCPLHKDSDASASLSRSGGLKCHVCCPGDNQGYDIFQWVSKLEGCTEVEALERIGRLYGVDTDLRKAPPKPRSKKRQTSADEDMVNECRAALVNSTEPRARFYRDFLQKRHLDPFLVAQNDVGYHEASGLLVFFQRRGNGELLPYWRTFDIVGGEKQWRWAGTRTAMQGMMRALWPLNDVEAIQPGQRVWIVEGEWDALTARCRLSWQDAKDPIHVLSVTHGRQGLRLPRPQVPDVLRECRITLAFDNDVWQHPDPTQLKAPSADQRNKLETTQESFLKDALAFYEMLATEQPLRIAAVPLPGDTKWKADLRDWCDVGGCDPADWQSWDFDDIRPDVEHPEPCTFETLLEHLNEYVVFEGSVDAIVTDTAIAPNLIELKCEAGARSFCSNCMALPRYSGDNWMIRIDQETKRKYAVREGREFERFVRDELLGRPSQCQHAELIEHDFDPCMRWAVGPRLETSWQHKGEKASKAERSKSIIVVSRDLPPISGNVRVTGHVMRAAASGRGSSEVICIYAEKVEPVSRVDIDVSAYHNDLLAIQGSSETVDEVEQCVQDMATDLAANLTHIYGQDEMHVATLLTFCSVLHLPDPDGGKEPLRGWLDVVCFGDTGAGKTPIAERIGKAMGAGYHSSPGNTSRAGFVMASTHDQSLGAFVTKPGTYLKHHSAGLVVDEVQLLDADVFDACQSARTNGVVKSGKAGGGDRAYDAAVRTLWLANWMKGARDNYTYACEHVAQLCRMKDESVRRFDFAIAVPGVEDWERVESQHLLRTELLAALAGRAWTIRPDQIDFENGCWQLARNLVRAAAPNYWPQEVPLFIVNEKDKSVMRIACAAAALTYSHPEGKPERLLVRRTHVEWAMRWLKRTFSSIEYDRFSISRIRSERVACPYMAEVVLTNIQNTDSVELVRGAMEGLGATFTMAELETSFTSRDLAQNWVAKAKALNVVNRSTRLHPNRSAPTLRLTKGAQEIRRNWIALLDERGDMAVRHRMAVLKAWVAAKPTRRPGEGEPPSLDPLTGQTIAEVLEHDYPDREEDIGVAEPMF